MPKQREAAVDAASSVKARACWSALLVHVLIRGNGILVLVAVSMYERRSAYDSLVRGDARWYRGIAFDGYGFSRHVPDGRTLVDYAFFPLYPGVERLVAAGTGLRILDAGLVVSATASVFACWGIFCVGAHMFDARTGVILVGLWSSLPISIVQSMAYTESLFTAFAAWSLYTILRQRYLIAGMLASLAGLTRPFGVAVAVAVMAAAAIHIRSERTATAETGPTGHRGEMARPAVGALVAPIGTVAFVAYIGLREHNALAYFAVQGQWGNGVDGGISFLAWTGRMLWGPSVLAGLLLCVALLALGAVIFVLIRDRYPLPIIVFTVATTLMALTTSGYFCSKPRYLLPVFPLLIPMATYLAAKRTAHIAAALVSMALVSSLCGAIWLLGPGPP